jgi:hypothetical protein
VVGTDVTTGQDFLGTLINEPFDYIITRPSSSLKDEFLNRCFLLRKPFALLLPISGLEGERSQKPFRNGLEVITFPTSPDGKNDRSPFQAVAWYTNGLRIKERQHLLPEDYELLVFEGERYMDAGKNNHEGMDCAGCERPFGKNGVRFNSSKNAVNQPFCDRCQKKGVRWFGDDWFTMEDPAKALQEREEEIRIAKDATPLKKYFRQLEDMAEALGWTHEQMSEILGVAKSFKNLPQAKRFRTSDAA